MMLLCAGQSVPIDSRRCYQIQRLTPEPSHRCCCRFLRRMLAVPTLRDLETDTLLVLVQIGQIFVSGAG